MFPVTRRIIGNTIPEIESKGSSYRYLIAQVHLQYKKRWVDYLNAVRSLVRNSSWSDLAIEITNSAPYSHWRVYINHMQCQPQAQAPEAEISNSPFQHIHST